MQICNLAIFVSGNGSNCENIIRHFQGSSDIKVRLVVSSSPEAYALTRAKRYGVETLIADKQLLEDPAFPLKLQETYGINFIVLAGFLRRIPAGMVEAFHRRMINLHPALLPKYRGKGMYGHHVHEAVKANSETETGMTVHWVSNEVDGGEIIVQHRTPLSPDDTVDDIARKEHELEAAFFAQDIEAIIRGIDEFATR